MADIKDDDNELLVVDLIADAPVSSEAGTVDAGDALTEPPTDSSRILEDPAGDEVDGGDGDVVWQQVGAFSASGSAFTRLGVG